MKPSPHVLGASIGWAVLVVAYDLPLLNVIAGTVTIGILVNVAEDVVRGKFK